MHPLDEIPPPAVPTRRWTRGEMPPYRHVPGLTVHPVNHPDGHSYRLPGTAGPREDPATRALPDGWRDCRPYLYGVDLFNYRYFWEAHEAWEEVWHAVGHRSVTGHFLQGLIQISAAHLKHHMGVPRGVTKLLASAGAHLDVVTGSTGATYMGVDLPAWRARVADHLTADDQRFPLLDLAGGAGAS